MRKLTLLAVVALATPAAAEPIFLARQYARCTTCHFSPTGGGLLTPYGRSLTRAELSTSGHGETAGREEAFLWGAFPEVPGLALAIDARPAHLRVDGGGQVTTRDFFMDASLQAAYRKDGFTLYGEFGRQPRSSGTKYDSAEHWLGYQGENGLGFRLGRFLPAYGVRLADHTSFTRSPLGLDTYDQLYALELSRTRDRDLLQLTVSPGRADSIVDDDGRRAFTAAGRYQVDLGPRQSLVFSGLFRDSSRLDPRSEAGGVAFGFAPRKRLSVWSEADLHFQQGAGSPALLLLNETSLEVHRGVWVRVSPQLQTEPGRASGGVFRLAVAVDVFPRTHFHLSGSYYRDDVRDSDLVVHTVLAQFHLYL